MPRLKNIINPRSYARLLGRWHQALRVRLDINQKGAIWVQPGHYYSPLLDIKSIGVGDLHMKHDGIELWEHVDLREQAQKELYEALLQQFPALPFPHHKNQDFRYFSQSGWFGISDSYALSALIRKERPKKIVEVGSGFSSAVMLDTIGQMDYRPDLTFIEPYPARLNELLRPEDFSHINLIQSGLQDVDLSVFKELEAGDILFIDSSHVGKVGSDVAFIFLRVLPKLKRGVLIHFHDIFFPHSYPISWLRDGMAWNESLILRTYLVGNSSELQIELFNSFSIFTFPELFEREMPSFLTNPGQSIWLRKL